MYLMSWPTGFHSHAIPFVFEQLSVPCLFSTENSWICGCSLVGRISERRWRGRLHQWSGGTATRRRSCRRNWQRAGNSMPPWKTSSAWRSPSRPPASPRSGWRRSRATRAACHHWHVVLSSTHYILCTDNVITVSNEKQNDWPGIDPNLDLAVEKLSRKARWSL